MDFVKDASLEQSHRFVEFRAEQTTYTGSNGGFVEINCDVPLASGEYMDMETARLVFDMNITTTASTYAYCASAWMSSLAVRAHNQTEIGNQCINYNRFVRLQKEMLTSAANELSFEDVLEGAQPVASAAGDIERAHKPLVNIFNFPGYFPVFACKGIQVRIDLAAPGILSSDATEYLIKNLRLECRLVKMKPEAHNQVLQQLASPEGLVIDFESAESTSKTVDTSTAPIYQFGRVQNRLKRVEVVEYTTGDHGDFQRNNISSYRYRLGSEYSTPSAIAVGDQKIARHLLHYLRAHKVSPQEMNVFANSNNVDTLLDSTRFVMASAYDKSKLDELISSADSKGMDLELHLTRSATGTAGTAYLFKVEDRRLQILEGAQIQQLS